MLVLFSRSLKYNSSLASTAATTAVNITATGLLGRLAFGEAASLQWWVGASAILGGSFLINRSQRQVTQPALKVPGAEGREPVAEGAAAAAAASPAKGGVAARRRTRRA